MYRINPMQLVGLGKEEGLLVSWLPDGMLVELSAPKLESLKAQYEERVAALQQQVSAMQNHQGAQAVPDLQAKFQKAAEALCQELGAEQREKLEQLLAQVTAQHQEQISQLSLQHAEEVNLQVQAMKIAAEQVHLSHLNVVQAELQSQHQEALAEATARLRRQFETQLQQESLELAPAPTSLQQFERLSANWERQYSELIQRLAHDLETRLTQVLQARESKTGAEKEGAEDKTQDTDVEEIQRLLASQREEMAALRSRCLEEFEESLRARSQSMAEQSDQVAALQLEIDSLQQQCQELLKERKAAHSDGASTQAEEQEDLKTAMEELKAYYEKRVETLEQTFSEEIAKVKAKYEADMGATGKGSEVEGEQLESSLEIPKERDYAYHAPMLTAISDSDQDSPVEDELRTKVPNVRELQQTLAERERALQELQSELEAERGKLAALESVSKTDKEQINALQAQLEELRRGMGTESSSSSPPRDDLLCEREAECEKYLHELSEKDQHIAELVEMESFLLNENGQLKEQLTELEERMKESEASEAKGGGDLCDKVKQLEKTVTEKQEECEKCVKDLQEREKELTVLRVEFQSLQEQQKEWRQREADLGAERDRLMSQLAEVEEKNKELQARLDDGDHHHQQLLEAMKQELEHEKQVEVETLQSEYKVQLEIELKRQAGQLLDKTDSNKMAEPDEVDAADGSAVTSKTTKDSDSDDGTSVDAKPGDQELLKESGEERNEGLLVQYKARIGDLEKQLKELENRHTSLLSGEGPEIEQLLKERYDNELELAKSFQQSEFDDMLKAEKKKFVERHRKLMDDFMRERQEEVEGLRSKHTEELEQMRASLVQEHEDRVAALTAQHQEALHGATSQTEESEDLSQVRQQLQSEIESLRQMLAEREQALETKEGEITAKLTELESLHQQKLLRITEEYESKVTQVKQELEAAHKDQLTLAAQDLETQLQAQHQEELAKQQQHLESKHLKELANLQQQQQEALQQLQSAHQADLEKLKGATEVQATGDSLNEVSEISMPVATVPPTATPREEELPVWSTPRPNTSEVATRSFAQVVSGIPPISRASPPPPSSSTTSAPASAPTSVSSPVTSADSEEDKDRTILKLRSELAALSQQLERKQAPEGGESLQEMGAGDNLLSMLRSDLEHTGTEREAVQRANDRLLQLLSDAVKTYVTVEDSINRRLARIVAQGSRSGRPGSAERSNRSTPTVDAQESHDPERRTPTPHADGAEGGESQDTTLEETSILSVATDEGLDVSQRLAESLFIGPDLDAEGEELVQDARGRLQGAVSQLLDMMERTTQQLIEAQRYQDEILHSLESAHQDLQTERARLEESEEHLRGEVSAKEYLAQELHKAEGLIKGYGTEQEEMEARLQRLEEEREVMAGDLERTRSKLADLESDQQTIEAQRLSIQRQQTLLQQNVGAENQGSDPGALEMTSGGQALLGELSEMTEERRRLQQQLKRQTERSQSVLRDMESAAEEQQRRLEKELESQRAEIADLKLQLDNAERQLKAKKQFIDEQSAEREQEREDFQKELDRMKDVVTSLDRRGSAQGRLQQEVADLTEQLENRISSHSEMLQRAEQMQRDLQDKELTTEELKLLVAQLEKELEEKGTSANQLRQRIYHLEEQLTGQVSESELSEHSVSPSAQTQRGSPTLLSPDRQVLPRNVLSLQEELLRARQQEEELQQEKELLQQQVQEQMLQISALRNQLDDLKHWGTDPVTSGSHLADLRQQLQALRDQLEKRDQEVGVLDDEKEKLKEKLTSQEAELENLRQNIRSGNLKELGVLDSLEQERDKLQFEVTTLKEQLSKRDSTVAETAEPHSQQSSLSGDYSLTEHDPRLLTASLSQRTSFQQELEQTVADRDSALVAMETELEGSRRQVEELQTRLSDLQAQLTKLQEDRDAGTDALSEKETVAEQLQEQVESLQQEIASLTNFQNELQKDFDEVQGMLEEKQRQMENLTQELADSRLNPETPDPELVEKLERELLAVKKELQEKINVINEKEEEMYVLSEKLELQDSVMEQLKAMEKQRDTLQSELNEAGTLTERLREVERERDVVQSELEDARTQLQQLKEELRHQGQEGEQDGALQMELYTSQEEKRLLEEELEEIKERMAGLEEKEKLLGEREAELEELRSRMHGEKEEREKEPDEEVEVREQETRSRERPQQVLARLLVSAIQGIVTGRTATLASHFSPETQGPVQAIADKMQGTLRAKEELVAKLNWALAELQEAGAMITQSSSLGQELAGKLRTSEAEQVGVALESTLAEKEYVETTAKLKDTQVRLQDWSARLSVLESHCTELVAEMAVLDVDLQTALTELKSTQAERSTSEFGTDESSAELTLSESLTRLAAALSCEAEDEQPLSGCSVDPIKSQKQTTGQLALAQAPDQERTDDSTQAQLKMEATSDHVAPEQDQDAGSGTAGEQSGRTSGRNVDLRSLVTALAEQMVGREESLEALLTGQSGSTGELTARLNHAENRCAELAAKTVTLESELQKALAELHQAKVQCLQARAQVMSAKSSSHEVFTELSLTESLSREATAMLDTAKAREELTEARCSSLESKLQETRGKLAETRSLAQERALEVEHVRSKLTSVTAHAALQEEKELALRQELATAREESQKVSQERADLQFRLQQLEQHLAEREEQLRLLQGSGGAKFEEAGDEVQVLSRTRDGVVTRSHERSLHQPAWPRRDPWPPSLSSSSPAEEAGEDLSSPASLTEHGFAGGESLLAESRFSSRKLDEAASRSSGTSPLLSQSRFHAGGMAGGRVASREGQRDDEDGSWRSTDSFSQELEEEESLRLLSATVELGNIRRHTAPLRVVPAASSGGSLWRSESEPRLRRFSSDTRLLAELQQIDCTSRSQRQQLAAKNRELEAIRAQLELWIKSGNSSAGVSALRVSLQETKVRLEFLEKRLAERDQQISSLQSQLKSSRSESSSTEVQDSGTQQEVEELRISLQQARDTIARLRQRWKLERPEEAEEEDEDLDSAPVDVQTLQRQLQQCQEELELFRVTASMSAADFVKKVMELRRELSSAHQEQIRDVQTRFADEEEARLSILQQRHQSELDQQQKIWERRLAAAVAQECQDLQQRHDAELSELHSQHQREIDMLLQSRTASMEEAAVLERLQAKVRDTEGLDRRLLQQLHSRSPDDADASVSDISSLDLTGDETISSRLQALMERLRRDGIQVLSLSELQFLQRNLSPERAASQGDVEMLKAAWDRERQTLVSTINSLKELLSQAHRVRIGDRTSDLEGDWRRELLTSLCNVFGSEREKLLAELRTFLSSQSADSVSALESLEKRIQDQEGVHQEALQQLLSADRQSLLEEVRELRSGQSTGRQQQHQELRVLQDKMAELENAAQKKEWQLQRQVQVLEYKLQQEQVIEEDLKASLGVERDRLVELGQQLALEKERSLELQTEMTSAQIQSSKVKDALEREQSRFTSVSDALEEVREERSRLLELLEGERQRRQALEDHAKENRSLQHNQQEASARFAKEIAAELEQEQSHSSELGRQLELERVRYTSLEQEMEAQSRLAQRSTSDLTNQMGQLQQALSSERERIAELAGALDRERQLRQTRDGELLASGQTALSAADLSSQLAAEQALVSDLQAALEREQSQTASARQLLDQERASAQQALQEEQSTSRELSAKLESLQRQLVDSQAQLERQVSEVRAELRDREAQMKTLETSVRRHEEEEQRLRTEAAANTRRQRQQENTVEELKVKVHTYELDIERLNSHIDKLMASRGTDQDDGEEEDAEVHQHLALSRRHLESILQRLEHVTVQLQELPLATEERVGSSSASFHQQLDNILSEVRQLQRPVTGQEARRSAEAVLGSFINERLLQHNAELNSYIAVLCREKEELRNANTQLEQEVESVHTRSQRSQQVEADGSSGDSEEEMLRQRAMWASEKLTLQMALDSAEREVDRLRVELQNFQQRLNSDGFLVNPSTDKMNKLYGKFLRAESYRRALIYQKRYLLQLIGGFEDCERETLNIMATMGAHPCTREVRERQQRFSRPLNRFRTAAYTSIAIYRLRYLVKKWRRATRVGSPVVTGRLDVNTGYVPSASSFSPPTTPPRTGHGLSQAATQATATRQSHTERPAYSHSERSVAHSHSERSSAYGHTERPVAYVHTERPVAYSHTERSMVYSHVERPSTYSQAERSTAYSQAERSTAYSQAERSGAYSHADRPRRSHHSSQSAKHRSQQEGGQPWLTYSRRPLHSQQEVEELSQETLDSSQRSVYETYGAGASSLQPVAAPPVEMDYGLPRSYHGREAGGRDVGSLLEHSGARRYPSAAEVAERLGLPHVNGSSTATSSSSSGAHQFSTPPTRERSSPRDLRSTAVGSARRQILQDFEGNTRPSSRSREACNDEFIQRLENLQQRLSGYSPRDHSRPKQRRTLSLR